MRFKETAVGLGLAGALVGCGSGTHEKPVVHNKLSFIDIYNKSDYAQVINCGQNLASKASVDLVDPSEGMDTLTLGATDMDPDTFKKAQTSKFLAGVTIYAMGKHTYDAVRSDHPGVVEHVNGYYEAVVPVNSQYSLEVVVSNTSDAMPLASISCRY